MIAYSCCELSSISVANSHKMAKVLVTLWIEGWQTWGRGGWRSNWGSTVSPLPSWEGEMEEHCWHIIQHTADNISKCKAFHIRSRINAVVSFAVEMRYYCNSLHSTVLREWSTSLLIFEAVAMSLCRIWTQHKTHTITVLYAPPHQSPPVLLRHGCREREMNSQT